MKQNFTRRERDLIPGVWHLSKRMVCLTTQVCLLMFFCLAFSTNVLAQTTVRGTVKDPQGGPLPGVSVKLKGTNIGASTGSDGRFSINIPSASGTLVVSFIGYKTQEIPINGRSEVNVTFDEDVARLSEVVVTGYGTQSRELLTTSIAKLDPKTLENIPYSNALSALQGSVSGVRVQSYNGQPGVAPRIILRGGTSINNPDGSDPLYIVDGVIRSNLNDVAADDIESLQILKDAAATSIYGARASDGVVLVTTKSAKPGAARISYSYDVSSADEGDQLREYTSAEEYIHHARQSVVWTGAKVAASTTNSRLTAPSGFGTGNNLLNNTAFTTQFLSPTNQHKLNEGWQVMTDPIKTNASGGYDPVNGTNKQIIFKDTDFQELTYQSAVSHNHYLSASGGTEKAKFSGSVGYLLGEGTALESDYKRLTASFNSSLQVTDKLRVDGRLLYANTDYKFITGGAQTQFSTLTNTFYRSPSLPSSAKYQFEDGTIAPGQSASAGNPHYYQTGPFAPQRKNTGQKLTVALSGKWDILPGLSFEPLLSSYEEEGFGRFFQPAYLSNVTTMNTLRSASQSFSNGRYYQADGVFTYVKAIADHHFEGKAGYSYYDRKTYSVSANGEGATTDLIPTLNASAVPRSVGGSEGRFITEGVFGRINYDYQQKYLLNLTGRYDGASNLGASNRFGFFPGVGLGWNMHKENFWKIMPRQFSSLKLRATYGENGNIGGLSEFGWQGLYSVGSEYAGSGAIQPSNIPNPDLRWEESRTFDGGVDIGLFNNRVSIIFDYFDRVTDNLITNVVLPSSSGYGTVQTNNGSLGNKGVELDLTAEILPASSSFKWSMNFNASKVSTKVLQLPDNGVEGNRQGGVNIWDPQRQTYVWRPNMALFGNPGSFMEGFPIGDYYTYKHLGVFATDEEAAAYDVVDMSVPVIPGTTNRKKFGGDAYFADIDGNKIIDSRDQVYVGNMFPDWTGGFSNYFNYKGFSLAIRTDFTLGHTIYNYAKAMADGQLQGDLMPTKDYIDKAWKKQGDITDTPRYLWQNSQQNISRSSTYFEKGDFLALREITVGYTIPQTLLRKVKISSARINLTGNNLHYFTAFRGPMPEDGGSDNGRYPNPRTFTLGTNISF